MERGDSQRHLLGPRLPSSLLWLMFLLVSVVSAFGTTEPSWADDFEVGRAAANRREFATAYALWRPLAERGDTRAQLALGKMFARGDGVGKDFKVARAYFKLAADQNDAKGQFNLAKMFFYGDGGPQDYAEAYELFKRASQGGIADADEFLRKLRDRVTPRTVDTSASASASSSEIPSATEASQAARVAPPPPDSTPPGDLMAPEMSSSSVSSDIAASTSSAAAVIDPLAPYRSTIARGSTSTGVRTFRFDPVAEAIIRGFPGGSDLIPTYDGSLFKGIIESDEHALANHLGLAQGGNADSQCIMGFAAQYAGNSEIARGWFTKAAAQGSSQSLFALGNLEFENNYERASQFYSQASDAGVVAAKRNLGYFLLRGIGVDQNKERGKVLLDQASKAGDALATDLLK